MLYEWDKRGLILSLWWVSWRDSRFLKKTIWCSVPPVCTGSALGNTILRVWVNLMAVNVVEGMDKGTHQGSRMRETAWKVCRQFVANHVVLRPTYRWRQYTMCSGAGICRPAWLSYYFLKVLKWLKLGGFLLSFLVVQVLQKFDQPPTQNRKSRKGSIQGSSCTHQPLITRPYLILSQRDGHTHLLHRWAPGWAANREGWAQSEGPPFYHDESQSWYGYSAETHATASWS